MRSKILIGTGLLVGVLGVATNGDAGRQARQSAIAYLREPTLIGSTIVQGPVVFTHDEAKMARGEPCTTVYLLEPRDGSVEEIAEFRCIAAHRDVVHEFTITTRPNDELGFGCVLAEFQFAGDPEGHGVPSSTTALASAEDSTETAHASTF